MKWVVIGASVLAIGIGQANAQPPPGYAPIPPPRYEAVPPPPGSRMVWEPGHWQWVGRGHYIERHQRPMRWVEGRWVWRGGHWVWVPAHWG
jgi:hypothetical protein